MTKSKRRPKAVKGALLIMVLTVMFVLIFLLAGTIAVVYSSHGRAINKYEESQAYYTARSVLDSYINTLLKDNTNKAGDNGTTTVMYYHIKSGSSGKVVDGAQAKQGRAMELDLYNLAVDLDSVTAGTQTDPANDANMVLWAKEMMVKRILGVTTDGSIDATTLTANGATASDLSDYSVALEKVRAHLATTYGSTPSPTNKYMYWRRVIVDAANPTADSFKHNVSTSGNYGVYYGVPDSASDDDQQYGVTLGSNSTAKFYDQFVNGTEDTMYYIVPAGTFAGYGSSTSNYGKLVDTVAQRQDYNSFDASYPDAVITVQMLERSYHINAAENSDFKYQFDSGVRAKDYIKVKVTAEVYYDGQPTTTSIVYKTKYVPKPAVDNALTTFGGINSSTSGFNVDGGMASLDTTTPFTFNASKFSGSLFAEGTIVMDTAGSLQLLNGGSFTVKGGMQGRNAINITANAPGSFVYCGGVFGRTYTPYNVPSTGSIDGNNQLNVGSASQAINVIAKRINVPQNGCAIHGKVYTECIDWTTSNPNGTPISDHLYTQDLILKNDSNYVSVSGTYTPGTPYNVTFGNFGSGTDNLFIGQGGFIVIPGAGTGSATSFSDIEAARARLGLTNNDLIIRVADANFLTTNTSKHYNKLTSPVKTDYNEPSIYNSQLTGDFKKEIKMVDNTTYALDTARSKYDQYFGENAFVNDATTDAAHLGDLTNYNDPWSNSEVETAEHRASSITGGDTCILSGSVSAINSGGTYGAGKYILNNSNVGNVVLDTSGGDIAVQFKQGGGDFMGNITITGSGKCTFLVPEDGATYNIGSTGTDLKILYDSTWNGTNGLSSNVLRTGTDDGSGLTAVPEVDFYVGNGSTLFPNRNSVVTGYIYGPGCFIKTNTNTHGQSVEYIDSGASAGTNSYWLFGSAICRDYDNSNVGVAFINRNTDTSVPGDCLFGWSDVYYMRGE